MKYGAIYLRLSKDDNGKNESESIANQRHLLLQYAETNAIPVQFNHKLSKITLKLVKSESYVGDLPSEAVFWTYSLMEVRKISAPTTATSVPSL